MMNEKYLEEIEACLRALIDSKKGVYPDKLHSAMEYALFPAGKRVRPYLMFLCADFTGVGRETIKPLAVALELIHNYSLIHDDLPCMDDDDFRRGKTSCHKAYGEAMALLAGDAMLNLAYEVLIGAVKENPDLAESAAYLARCAGAEGMIGGQAIEFSADSLDEAGVTELCMKKTGALICAAAVAPSLLCGDKEKINALGTYAAAVGLCFQLRDDLLDASAAEEKSYLSVMGREYTENMAKRLSDIAIESLSKWESASELAEFGNFLAKRKK